MAKYWSATTTSFWDSAVVAVAQMPSDKVAITDAEYSELMSKQESGYHIVHNSSTGKPQALDQSLTDATRTVQALDSEVVHKTGAETVAGVKTFTATPRISGTNPEIHLQRTDIAKGTTPSAAASHSVGLHDKNGVDIANTLSAVQFTLDTDGNTKAELYAFKNTASSTDSAKIGITHPASGDPYTYAPTPAAGDNSTKIATTAFVNTKAASYLPLAGGTMTGNITGNRDEFTILKKDDAGSTVIRGGSAYASGASLILFGKDDENAGIARLVAHDGTSNNNIVLYPDGKATVGGSDIITAAGGQMEGPLRANTEGFVTGVADDDSVRMSGGTGWDNGASIVVYGKSHASYPGAFRVKAEDGTNEAVLLGKPDGELTWGGKNVVTAAGTGLKQSTNTLSLATVVTAGDAGPTSNATPAFGATFTVPYITYDAYGRVTGRTNRTVKIPAAPTSVTTATKATTTPNVYVASINKPTLPSGGTWKYFMKVTGAGETTTGTASGGTQLASDYRYVIAIRTA